MLKPVKPGLLFIFMISSLTHSLRLSAQEEKKADASAASYFKLSAGYLSNSVYNGRKDSTATPYITPSLAYYDKSGFYISGALSYLSSATDSRIDLFSLDLGYDFTISDKFSGGVYANKSFYKQTSTSIKSDIKGMIGGNMSYDAGPIQLNGGADLIFGTKTDMALNLGLSHAFYLGEEDNQFSITPTFLANMSTLHFYEGYTSRKIAKNLKKLNPNVNSTSTTKVDNSTGLTLMDYELSLPLTYDLAKAGFFLTPAFAIPKNPIYTTTTTVNKLPGGATNTIVTNSTPATEKSLSSSFFVELGLYIKF